MHSIRNTNQERPGRRPAVPLLTYAASDATT